MPKIPMGEFGQSRVPFQPTPTATAAQLDGGLSEATQRLGSTIAGIGQDAIDQQAAEAKREKLRAEAQAENELRQAQDLRERLEATTAVKGVANDVKLLATEIQQDITSGKVSPNDTGREFEERSNKLLNQRLEGMHPTLAAQVRAGTLDELGNAKIQTLHTAAAQTKSLARATLLSTREEFERSALVDRPKALQQYQMTLESAAAGTGMSPEQVQVELQTFREKTARSSADLLITSARDDKASLEAVRQRLNSDEFHDLSPETRGPLETRVLQRLQFLDNQKTQQVIRAQAAQERRERAAERAVGELEKLFDSGHMADDKTTKAYADQVAGTSFAPRFRELVTQSAERAGFAQLSPDQQRNELLKMRAKVAQEGTNPDLQARISRFETIQQNTAKALEDDGLTHGARTGLITLKPLNLTNLNQLSADLGDRVAAAEAVSTRVRRDVAPFTKDEALQVASSLGALSVSARETAVASLANAMPRGQARAFAKQIKDREPTLGLAMFQASIDPKGEALPLILRGQDAVKAGRIKGEDADAKRDAQTIAKRMEQLNWGTPAARDAATDTANAILLGMRDRGTGGVNKAIELATGGIGEWGDSKVPLPRGMDSRQFERRLDSLRTDPTRLAAALGVQPGAPALKLGDAPMTVEQLAGQLGKVKLISAGPGTYALEAGGVMVTAPNGRPVRLNLEK